MANFTTPMQYNTAASYYGGNDTVEGRYTPQWLIDLAQRQGTTLGINDSIFGGNVGWKLGDYLYSGTAQDLGAGMGMGNQFYRYKDTPLVRQALAANQGSLLNGTGYDMLDERGNVVGSGNWENIADNKGTATADAIVTALAGGVMGGVASGALSSGAGGAAAAGGSGGAVTGLGEAGTMYAGADAASAATLGGGASINGGAALAGSTAGIGGLSGAGGSGAMGAGGATGTTGATGATGAGGAGGATAGGGSFGSAIQNIFGGSGMSWTDWIGPALQLVGGAYQANQAGNAADAQIAAGDRGIDEIHRQFDTVRQLLSPYVTAGNGALGSYQALSGAQGADAQAREIAALQGTPQFGALTKAGEDAILQNAAATGGLRGGNTQGALADQRTRILSGLIDQQLGRYGSLVDIGQNSAAGTGSAAMSAGQQVSGLMQQQGAAQAGGIVAGSNAFTNALGGIGGFAAARGTTTAPTYVGDAHGYMNTTNGGFGSGTVYGNQDMGQYF